MNNKKKNKVSLPIKLLAAIGVFVILGVTVPLVLKFSFSNLQSVKLGHEPIKPDGVFDVNIIYGNGETSVDYNKHLIRSAREVYDATGIQLYFVYMYYDDTCETREDSIKLATDYIKSKGIWKDNGYYYIEVVKDYDRDYTGDKYNAAIYGHTIGGDKAINFMSSDIMKAYQSTYKEYYRGKLGSYYSNDECHALAMSRVGYLIEHPVLSRIKNILKILVIFIIIPGLTVYVIIRLKKKRETLRILNTPMRDLKAERADALKEKYENEEL